MARINSKIDGTDVLGVVSAGETLYVARATYTQFGTVKPSIKDFVFDKDSAEFLVRLGIGLKHTEDGIALAIYDGNYVTDVESTGDGLLIKYTDIDDGTTSEKTIPWEELNETQFNELKDYVANHELAELDFPHGEFTDVQYSQEDGIALTGVAKAKYKDSTESDVNMSFDIPLVAGDETVVIDRAEQAKEVLIKATKGLKAIQSTDKGGLEFTLSDGTKLYTAPVGGVGVDIGTDLPASTVQGTLTAAQLEILQASEDNYIMFQHEKYYLNDKGHKEGFLTYTYTGYENNTYWIKSITITISTLAWVLNKGGFAGNGLEFDSNDKLQAKLGTGLSFGTDGSITATATDNPYMNTSKEIQGLTGLTASTTLSDIVNTVRANRTNVLWNELSSSADGTQLVRLFGLPNGVFSSTYNKIYFKMIADTPDTPPNQVVIQVYLTVEDANGGYSCYIGTLYSRSAGVARWTGWVKLTNTVEHPAPLYVGEQYEGADAYYSVISFDSHNQDLIFRANYTGKDIKLSQLALKSEIPSGGSSYRHELVLTSSGQWDAAICLTVYSNTSVAADSFADFYDLFNSRNNQIFATGYAYENGNYSIFYSIYAIKPTAMATDSIQLIKFDSTSSLSISATSLSWASSGLSWTVFDKVTNL